MSTNWKDKSWQKEFLEMKAQKPKDMKLLLEGPKGFLDVLKLGALHNEYIRIKRIRVKRD